MHYQGLIYLIGFTFYSFLMIAFAAITYGLTILVYVMHLILIFYKSGAREIKAFEQFNSLLMKNEKIIAKGIDMRPFALFTRRKLIGVTDSRIILMIRPLLGGFNMIDIQWKDLRDVRLGQNMLPKTFGSRISFYHSLKMQDFSSNIDFHAASKMYQIAQKEEQSWEEKRRIRKIEETRAAAGGTYVTTGASADKENNNTSSMDYVMNEITKAKKMLDEGIISDAEFEELKSKIINTGKSV